jgi:GntR family transcriptional regulator
VWATEVQERRPEVDPITVTRTEVPADIGSTLGIEAGSTVVLRDRRYVVEGRPVQLARSYLPLDLAADTQIEDSDTGPGGVYARLDELGHGPVRFRESLRARMPGPEEQTALELPPGTPVIEIVRVAQDEGGRIVEVNVMILDSSCYVLDYDMSA